MFVTDKKYLPEVFMKRKSDAFGRGYSVTLFSHQNSKPYLSPIHCIKLFTIRGYAIIQIVQRGFLSIISYT